MKTVYVLLIVAGVSLVGFVGCCGVVGMVINSIPEPTAEQLAAREAADEEKKAQYEERNKNVKDHLDLFLVFAKDTPVTHVSSYSDKIKVTVSNEFFLVPKRPVGHRSATGPHR